MLTVEDVITSSGKYPERANSPELTDEVRANIVDLLARVNPCLAECGIEKVKVSSGFRPSAVNAAIPTAAKKSAHLTGKAVDLEDPEGKLKQVVGAKPGFLRKHGLMMEDPTACKTWMHLDTVARADRPSRTFKP